MHRFSGRREVAIGLGAYAVYLAARAVVFGDRGRARAARNAQRLIALEERLGIHLEGRLQELVLPRRRALAVLNIAYVVLNVVITVGWLMLLYRRRDPRVHRLRRAAVLATLGAQPFFLLFPVAPPRSQDGFVDTVSEGGIDLDSGLVVRLYNPLAAFPSIHVAFAVVTAAGLREAARSPWARALAPAYPPAVGFTIVVTANHYVLDAAAGWALARLALRAAR